MCAKVQPILNKTDVLIIQHPKEQRKSIGTAKLVEKSLLNCSIKQALFKQENEFAEQLRAGDVLLYPHPDAIVLNESPQPYPCEISRIIVLDGTWSQAKTILKANPILLSLPKISFTTSALSNYRIRKEPKNEYFSTIESIGMVLRLIENNPAIEKKLNDYFTTFIDKQINIAQEKSAVSLPRTVKRKVKPKSIPVEFINPNYQFFIYEFETLFSEQEPHKKQPFLFQYCILNHLGKEIHQGKLRFCDLTIPNNEKTEFLNTIKLNENDLQEYPKAHQLPLFLAEQEDYIYCTWNTKSQNFFNEIFYQGNPPKYVSHVEMKRIFKNNWENKGGLLSFFSQPSKRANHLEEVKGRISKKLIDYIALFRVFQQELRNDVNKFPKNELYSLQKSELKRQNKPQNTLQRIRTTSSN